MKNENIFFTAEKMTVERLTWVTEILKLYCTRYYPESLHHHPRISIPSFYLFLSGDACYSLVDHRYAHLWEILFKLPPVRFVIDPRELLMRGISIEPFRLRGPDQVISPALGDDSPETSFVEILLDVTEQDPADASFGFLHLESPYMHTSPSTVISLFHAAIEKNISPELYGYLDGVHSIHRGQSPTMSENFGDSLVEMHAAAVGKGLTPRILVCSRSATTRGYSTFTTETGSIISSCIIPAAKIRDISQIVVRFRKRHPVLSHSACFIQTMPNRKIPYIKPRGYPDPPPLVVLVTHSPYGNEIALGAITFATACAHQGIATRVVFIEDGIYTLFGNHCFNELDPMLNLQSVITATSRMDNLGYSAYIPSFQERGLLGSPPFGGVQRIDTNMLAQILFQVPSGVVADRQRVLIF